MQSSAFCRSRRELSQSSFQIDPNSNEYLLAKIGVDTAENEPLEVWGKIIQYYSFASLGQILAKEEELISAHRGHVDAMVELMKEEHDLVNDVDQPGSMVEDYVDGLDRVLDIQLTPIFILAPS